MRSLMMFWLGLLLYLVPSNFAIANDVEGAIAYSLQAQII